MASIEELKWWLRKTGLDSIRSAALRYSTRFGGIFQVGLWRSSQQTTRNILKMSIFAFCTVILSLFEVRYNKLCDLPSLIARRCFLLCCGE